MWSGGGQCIRGGEKIGRPDHGFGFQSKTLRFSAPKDENKSARRSFSWLSMSNCRAGENVPLKFLVIIASSSNFCPAPAQEFLTERNLQGRPPEKDGRKCRIDAQRPQRFRLCALHGEPRALSARRESDRSRPPEPLFSLTQSLPRRHPHYYPPACLTV